MASKAKSAHDACVMVVNAGSSSLKFKLFGIEPFAAGWGGVVERIGDVEKSRLIAKGSDANGQAKKCDVAAGAKDHTSALQTILDFLRSNGVPKIADQVKAVGHRVVHGLDISAPVLLTPNVVQQIKNAQVLAPLHNPPGLVGIAAAQEVFKGVPQVGVFDTAYHQTMPDYAYMYALPMEFYTKHNIRRYGFHGTSHKYLVQQAAVMMGKNVNDLNCITCHLGNGSSITAVKNGHSVDTTMGMTPLEGLIMGTRAGDIDPAIPLHMANQLGISTKEIDSMLNKKSGLLGICGHSDLRTVIDMAAAGDKVGQLALNMFVYRVRKYIGAYTAALDGMVDCIIYSAGIGENSSIIRRLLNKNFEGMGILVDDEKNKLAVGGVQMDISAPGSKVKVLVIPTDEELSIAQQTLEVVGAMKA